MADETTTLGFDASEAFSELVRFSQALNEYTRLLRDNAKATRTFNTAQGRSDSALRLAAAAAELAADELSQLVRQQTNALSQQRQLNREVGKFKLPTIGKAVMGGTSPLDDLIKRGQLAQQVAKEEAKVQKQQARTVKTTNLAAQEAALRALFRGAEEVGEGLDKADKKAQAFSLTLGSIAKIAATQFILSGLFRVTSAFGEGIRAAKDYELQLAAIQTISKEFASRDLDQISDSVAEISTSFGLPIQDVAQGLYDTLSNQVGTAAESLRFLGDAAIFARATQTSLADSGNLLASVLKSYNLSAASAADVTGKLFRAIDLGRISGDELANTLGRVAALGRETNVSIDEILAALASLTIEGIGADEAMTLVSNVMLKLIRPTEALSKELQRLGFSSAELGIQALGLQGFLQVITEQSGTAASEVGELFNQIRGTRGVLGLVGKSAETYASTLKQIQEANAETARSAEELIRRTSASSLNEQIAEAQEFLTNDLGRPVIAAFTNIVDSIGGAKVAIIAFGSTAVTVGGLIAGVGVVGATTRWSAALTALAAESRFASVAVRGLGLAMKALPWALAIAGAAGLFELIRKLKTENSEADKVLSDFAANRREQASKDLKQLDSENKQRQAILQETVVATEKSLRTLQQLYNKDFDSAINVQEATNSALHRQLDKRVSLLQSFVGNLQNIQSRTAETIKDLNQETLNLKFDAGQSQFERSIEGQDPAAQAQSLLVRSGQVLRAAQDAAAKGNREFAETLFSSSAQLAERAAQLDERNQGQVNRILQERIAFNNKLVQQEQAKARAAQQVEAHNAAIADEVARRVSRLKELDLLSTKEENSQKRVAEIEAQRTTEIKAIEAALRKVRPADFDKVLGSVSARTQFREITERFRDPLTGVATSLSGAFESQSKAVLQTLQKNVASTPLEFRIKFKDLSGREFDPIGGPKAIAEAFAAAQAEVRTDFESLRDIPQLRSDRDIARSEFNVAGAQAIDIQRRLAEAFQGQQASDLSVLLSNLQLQTRIEDPIAREAALTETITKLNSFIEKQGTLSVSTLQNISSFFSQNGVNSAALQDLTSRQREFVTQAIAAAREQAEAQAKLNPLEELQKAAPQATQELRNLGTAARTAAQAIQAQQQSPQERELVRQIFGRAKGGPIGPDTITARLTPGEFVMNPRASQAFRPLLSMLNNAALPRFAQGGSVTNVGDINISISGAAAERVNARDLAQALKREIRKGTIR